MSTRAVHLTLAVLLATYAGRGAATVPDDRPLVTVPVVVTAPTIDGRVEPGEWAGAAVTCGFRDVGTGLPARGLVTVFLCYDARALYCRFDCRGEELTKLVGRPAARDAEIWSGSEVEVFLAPLAWPTRRYAHLMVNHAGAIADETASYTHLTLPTILRV